MYEDIQPQATEEEIKSPKSWSYTEKTRKVTTEHTLIVSEKRLSHLVEAKSTSTTLRQRTDIRLDDVYAVKSGYSVSRNIPGLIVSILLAAIFAIASLICFTNNNTGIGLVFLVLTALFVLIAVLISKRIKPSFVLQIDAVLPRGQLISNSFKYGNPQFKFGATAANAAKGLFNAVRRLFGVKGRKYKFIMSPEVGNEIVDTIGEYLIKD